MSSPAAPQPRLAGWLRSESGVKLHPALRIDADTNALSLDANVPKGAPLIDLPAAAVLSSGGAVAALGSGAASLAPAAALAAMLLKERAAGASSPHAALIGALPRAMNQPFLWDAAQLARLAGSALRGKAAEVRAGIEEEWKDVCELLGLSASLEDYLWAQAVVGSRAVALGAAFPLALAPGADLAPHAAPGAAPTVAVLAGSGGFFSAPRLLLATTADLSAGTALTSAGADGAWLADYVLDHGAVPAGGAELAAVDLRFTLAPLDPFYDDKVDVLAASGVPAAPLFAVAGAGARGLWTPPEGMEAFVRLVCLGATDAFLLEAVFRSDVYGFMALPVSADNERALCDAVIAACEDALDGYGAGGGGGDGGDAGEGVGAVRAAVARAVVDAETGVLRAAVGHYRKQLEGLDAKEYYQERRLKALDLLRPLDESEIVDSEGGGRMSRAFDDNY